MSAFISYLGIVATLLGATLAVASQSTKQLLMALALFVWGAFVFYRSFHAPHDGNEGGGASVNQSN